MGTTSSRIQSDSSRNRVSRRRFSSNGISALLVCGCSSLDARRELEKDPVEVRVRSSDIHTQGINVVQKLAWRPFSKNSRGKESSSTNAEAGSSSESRRLTSEHASVIQSDKHGKCSVKNEEINVPLQVSDETCRERSGFVREEESSNCSTVHADKNASHENHVNDPMSCTDSGPRSSFRQEFSHLPSNLFSEETHLDEYRVAEANNNDLDSVSHVPGLQETLDPIRDSTRSSGLEFPGNGLRQIDAVASSSSSLSGNSAGYHDLETRRNRRRVLLDAISRRSSGRSVGYPDIDSSNDTNDQEGSQNTELLESNADNSIDAHRVNGSDQQRRHSRSEMLRRLFSGIDSIDPQDNNVCPYGVHANGSCSCNSFLSNDESNIHASITRIVRLAEALFEVLDEINHRPASFSLPLVSVPAPEPVVDSLPVKNYQNLEFAGSEHDVQQCYICLAEYEEGDVIRVLPCHHEYHMACVDKWLKEIHGVCPLCRGDVSQNATAVETSSVEISSRL